MILYIPLILWSSICFAEVKFKLYIIFILHVLPDSPIYTLCESYDLSSRGHQSL